MIKKKRFSTRSYGALAILIAGIVLLFVTDRLVGVLRPNPGWMDKVRGQSYYADQSWTEQYISDANRVGPDSRRYYPYVLWRRTEFKSPTVNVDRDGNRWVPHSDCGPNALKVFLFGSSVLWGLGAPDWLTIPALLQEELSKTVKGAVCVVNLAEVGWTSTQSVTALILELQKGSRPNLIVFAQGISDLMAALENNNAYLHLGYSRFAGRLDSPAPFLDLVKYLLPTLSGLLFHEGKAILPFRIQGPTDGSTLYDTAARIYGENMRVVMALSKTYGFRFRSYWLPDPFYGGKILTPEEAGFKETQARKRNLSTEKYQDMLKTISREAPGFSLMGDVFDREPAQVYVDYIHLNPVGNARIARRLSKSLRPFICGPSGASIAPGGCNPPSPD